jgi:hypothetical protein
MRLSARRTDIFCMTASHYRHQAARNRKRMVEFVFAFAFTMSVMIAVVGAVALHSSSHFSCAARSITTMSDGCSSR